MGELAAAWRGGRWRGGRRLWVWLVAAVLVLALVAYGVVHALTAGASTKPKPPATAAVDSGAVTTEVATTGTVQPAQTRSLSFAVAGTVATIGVRAGSTVTPGQKLATVDDTDATAAVNSALNSLNDAEDALTQARANAAKATTSTACTGVNVPAGYPAPSVTPSAPPTATPSPQPTATRPPRPTPTHTASPTRGPTRGTTPQRSTAAGGSSSCAGSARSGSQSGGSQSGGSQSGGSQSGGSQSGGSQSGGSQSGGTDAVYSAQQRVTQATVTLENAQDALDGTTITAPIAGRILSVAGKVGSQVSASSTFITLADVYDMQISADFPEADADRLAVKQAAVATLADRTGQSFKATVVQVDPIGTSDGTMVRYGVLLSFVDPPKDLLVGQSANVRVTTGAENNVLRVPSTAVHDVAGSTGTVQRGSGGGNSEVKVGIGLRGDQYTQITSGLTKGDTVVRSW